ncbi:MAG: hypothetical protein WB812_09420 [Woeseiaceae bacterium]
MSRVACQLRRWPAGLGIVIGLLAAAAARADGIVVDRVYDPYVQPLEAELEWRSVHQSDDVQDLQRHMLGIGRSLSDRWEAEVYAAWTQGMGDDLALDLFEVEAKWQLTEQGEYAFDWGVVFGVERKVDSDISAATATLISAKDFGRWTAVGNLTLAYEEGTGVTDEFETALHLQARYRYREALEPGIEFHIGQNTSVLGPAFAGTVRFAPAHKLRWEAGLFWALDDESPDRVARLNLEYEF